ELLRERATDAPVPMTVLVDRGSLGRIRNVAVGAASAPVVAFTDSDCVPEPDWLAALLVPLHDPEVGVVQGVTRPDPTSPRRRFDATQELTSFTGRYEACNIAYRTEPLQRSGGFDESIGFFGEDTAAGLSIRRAGWQAAFAPDAVVHHVVTHPGLPWHLRRALGYANWNTLVRRYPELRDELWHRYFLRQRSAAFTAAVAGVAVAVATRRVLPLAMSLPYVAMGRPRGRGRAALVDAGAAVAFDAAVFAGLVRGTVRERTVVL
ncbi:MAG TPA: glycosyltransferase family 2 protein, partial [Acidimicrobiales bacterium]|nr:glycosyltransferase family 2 protein [Acidimicrobiales bacterium]